MGERELVPAMVDKNSGEVIGTVSDTPPSTTATQNQERRPRRNPHSKANFQHTVRVLQRMAEKHNWSKEQLAQMGFEWVCAYHATCPPQPKNKFVNFSHGFHAIQFMEDLEIMDTKVSDPELMKGVLIAVEACNKAYDNKMPRQQGEVGF